MHRFFLTYPPKKNETFEGSLCHQISRVFRAKKGENIILFTTGSDDYEYTITEIKKDYIVVENTGVEVPLSSRRSAVVEGGKKAGKKGVVEITVFHALPNNLSTIELIVEKFTELGIKRVVFFRANRSQILEISTKKQDRISRISIEALEQCGGNEPLIIEYSDEPLSNILEIEKGMMHIMAHQNGSQKLDLKNHLNIGLWIGPEGGWSPEEEQLFQTHNITQWSFATHILRLETAGIVGAGILSYLGK